jgi:hypothetical protein
MVGSLKTQFHIANECGIDRKDVASVVRRLKIVGFKREGFARSLYTPKQQSLIQAKLHLEGKCKFLTLESKINTQRL